ncbi:MAG: hypothetical protein F6K19_48100, partial [Cyanothece sp. SIO1E1]|nr:hypothetical protein [Cyanothece sp. SIO1E1]
GIGGSSLYRHRDLWHPDYLWEPESAPITSVISYQSGDAGDSEHANCLSSAQAASIQVNQSSDNYISPVSARENANQPEDTGAPQLISLHTIDESTAANHPSMGPQYIQQVLLDIKARTKVIPETPQVTATTKLTKDTAYRAAQENQRQKFLTSGDPILIAEAQQWQADKPNPLHITPHPQIALPEDCQPQHPYTQPHPSDLSDTLAAISVQLCQLAWSPTKVKKQLLQLFGKPNRALLSDLELEQWLTWLEMQVEIA